ncbi:MAG: beta-N-acetylhexosaminidase [Alphaproteobacteria bacterium]|nr:beta-N-acetylhexosaminidase [Alphaproteobacteria bacterium]
MLNEYPSAVVFGCAGLALSDEEKEFFSRVNPLGFILFSRNIATPEQLKTLIQSLRETVEREDVVFLIDQEGGRVSRLKPPYWLKYPPARTFGDKYRIDPEDGVQAAYETARLIGRDLCELGFNVDCAPVLDVPVEGSIDTILGDRTFSLDPELNGPLGKIICDGLLAEGVLPVVKHMPGHGRAVVDSHLELPKVSTDLETLKKTDFVPFKFLADAPWGMTAHVLYTAIDAHKPASLSNKVIQDIIRDEIGFKGFLICDDLSMKALSGSLSDLAAEALTAGCDAVLHCNGKMDEMELVASGVEPLSPRAMERFVRGQEMVKAAVEQTTAFDYDAAKSRLSKTA